MTRRLPLLLLLLLPALTGCLYSREMAHVRHDFERQNPQTRLDQQVVLNLGPTSLRLTRWLARRVDDDDSRQAADYLQQVRRVKVGVYDIKHRGSREALVLPSLRSFERDGWEVAVQVREDDQSVWVLYREHRGRVRDMYVLAVGEDQLVVTRLEGHLDRLLAQAIEDHHAVLNFGR